MYPQNNVFQVSMYKPKIDQLEKDRSAIFNAIREIASKLKKGQVKKIVLPAVGVGAGGGKGGGGGKGMAMGAAAEAEAEG